MNTAIEAVNSMRVKIVSGLFVVNILSALKAGITMKKERLNIC